MSRDRLDPTKRKHMTSIELPPEMKAGLDLVRERDGILQSEQIRRAVAAWLKDKGVDVDALRAKPTGTNRRGKRA
jgi:Arc/MetJ-type ribon-helix-helix transcriptional regulator